MYYIICEGGNFLCKKFILSGVSICLIIYVCILAYRTPIPIIKDVNNCKVAEILYNETSKQNGVDLTLIEDFNEDEILNCISKYEQRRTFKRAFSKYAVNNPRMEFDIYIIIGDGESISIRLGEEDFCYGFDDDLKREIINSSDLHDKLRILILKGKY